MKIIANRKKFFCISAAVIIIGFAVILFNGLNDNGFFNLDVEFSGGLSMNIDIGTDFNNNDIVAIISEVTGQSAPQVQRVTGTNQAAVKIRSLETDDRIALVNAISERYGIGEDSFEIADISATVSGEMQKSAIRAVVIASLLMLIYISIRFKGILTGAAALTTVLHDGLFVIACYGVFRIPINNSFIAVILTILGYAINNNIVVFDRIRENRKTMRRVTFAEIIDKSVNQSLKRCIFTTTTTLLTITTLYILGVPSIKEFSLPIILGLLCGMYSSVCFSGSMLYTFSKQK